MAQVYHKHTRLQGRDYTQGTFYVTLCSRDRKELFGRITRNGNDAVMDLNDAGRIVDECWQAIPAHFPHVRLDETQIMPDHLHAILILVPGVSTWSTRWVDATTGDAAMMHRPKGPQRGSPGAIIGAFKSVTTKRINATTGRTGRSIWQYGFHERIVRQYGCEHGRIAQYIAENPANWR